MAMIAPQIQPPYGSHVILALTIFTVTQIIVALTCTSCNQHQLNREFLPAENRELYLQPYRQTVTQSPVLCVRDCHADPNCASVNYNTNNYLCGLNNGSRNQYPDDFITNYDSVYFDADVDTPLFSMHRYSSCEKLLEASYKNSIYTIFPAAFSDDGLKVSCEGGWVVIQRRQDGSVDFYRNWTDYQVGFGNLAGEFWIGNDILRTLTEPVGTWELRVDMVDWDNVNIFAEYGDFGVSGDNYQLNIGPYNTSSTAGDALTSKHNGKMFSTKDNDNDNSPDSCSTEGQGGWWYDWCYQSNLNGKFHLSRTTVVEGMKWNTWKIPQNVKTCSMKIRPMF